MKHALQNRITGRTTLAFALAMGGASAALAAPSVGVVGPVDETPAWCTFFSSHGFDCTNLPPTGPAGTFDTFDVIVVLQITRPNAGSELAAFVRQNKGVLVWGAAANELGITTDPVVQAWIGATSTNLGGPKLFTSTLDPIVDPLAPGTLLIDCPLAACLSLTGTESHPSSTVLAAWELGSGAGILSNEFEGGRVVWLTNVIAPAGSQFGAFAGPTFDAILVNSVTFLAGVPTVPALGEWGLVALGLALVAVGTAVVRTRARRRTF